MPDPTDLEARVQLLEAIEAIRRLKIAYARVADDGYPGDRMAVFFTEDAVWDGGEAFGVHHGRAAIKELFDGVSSQISFALHYMIGHTIDVNLAAGTATGHWYLWAPMIINNKATLGAITYDDQYRKVGNDWLASRMTLNTHFVTPYEDGWVKTPMFSDE